MQFPRSAGVLVHPTSFPGRYGIGDLGDAAYELIDFLVASKQSRWQILPLGPTGYGDSPYQCFSAFAGNPLLINPDRLVRDGFLPARALDAIPDLSTHKVDYGPVIALKNEILSQAYRSFQSHPQAKYKEAFEDFCDRNAPWLDDFALFMALKSHHMSSQGGVWNTWPKNIANRELAALEGWSSRLAEHVEGFKFQQFLFFQQWLELKDYANKR